jgi:hypothetical protein
MRLPNPEIAVVDLRKLRDYCLIPEHPRGKHKAQVFSVVLGLGADDAEELRETLLSAARSEEAFTGEEDEYGKRYVLDFEVRTAVGTATVCSGWIVRHGEDFPRLTSCYVV